MAETVSTYELKNKRRTLLGELNGTPKSENQTFNKEKFKSTAEGLGRDLILGVIGGGLAGAVFGKYSFVVGLGVAGIGHYSENKMLSALGLGMMATGTYQALTGKEQDPNKPVLERVTERVEAFKTDFKRKLWIDKFNEKKEVKQKNKEDKGAEDLNGLKASKTEQSQPQKEKQAKAAKADVSDLSKEEQEYLEKEINAMVDEKIDEYMQMKNAKSSGTSKSNTDGVNTSNKTKAENKGSNNSSYERVESNNNSSNRNDYKKYDSKDKNEIESWEDIQRIM